MNKRKQRDRVVQINFGRQQTVNEVLIDKQGTLQLRLDGEPIAAESGFIQTQYERDKGPKVLHRAPVAGTSWPTNPNDVVTWADRIFIVDTNTKRIGGGLVHATAVVLGIPHHQLGWTLLQYGPMEALEFRGEFSKPERFAWRELMEAIRRSPTMMVSWRAIFVVDSELDLLLDINARDEPVWGDYYLPPRFKLMYASADVGKESPWNLLMSQTDRYATSVLRAIERTDPVGHQMVLRSRFTEDVRMRQWNPPG